MDDLGGTDEILGSPYKKMQDIRKEKTMDVLTEGAFAVMSL